MRGLNPKTHAALIKLDAMIKQKGILAATLFRDRTFNTSVGAVGNIASHDQADDLLDASEFAGILEKAGIALAPADVRAIIHAIDQDGNGELDVRELTQALRATHNPGMTEEREAKLRASVADALAHRIGIMANGRLRVLGSAQHLKSRHGGGYPRSGGRVAYHRDGGKVLSDESCSGSEGWV